MTNKRSTSRLQTSVMQKLGQRRMQELLDERKYTTTLSELKNLRRRFRRRFNERKLSKKTSLQELLSEALERHRKLQSLWSEFSVQQKRRLLTLLVPKDLAPTTVASENWFNHTITPPIVVEMFMNRFEHISPNDCRSYLDGSGDIPDGMESVEAKLKGHRENIGLTIKKLNATLKATQVRLRACYRSNKTLIPQSERGKDEIMKSIQHILGKNATKNFHDGASTYAEPTLGSIERIAAALNVKPMTRDDIILDLGSGAATTLWHLCQYHNCKGVGIEYGENRMRSAAKYTADLLKKHKDDSLFNPQVINTHGDIMNLTMLPPCTVLYIFDEAFPDVLMEKIFELIDTAPPRLQYVITFKANKFPKYRAMLDARKGFKAISLSNKAAKAYSQEGSKFDLYERTVEQYIHTGTDDEKYESFWDGSIERKIKFYEDLESEMDKKLDVAKASRHARLRKHPY